jgi:hypothetical protein
LHDPAQDPDKATQGQPLIYICIPTHNEQQTVGVVLWKLRQVLTEFPRDYQLLVADDASTDKTIEVLEPYTRVLPLTVISSRQRQGYAASLEMLLREAVRRSEYPKRDVIVTLQADFSEEPDDVVGLIKRMEAGADVAVGIKVPSGTESRLRRLARSLSRFFVRREKWPEGVVTPFDGYRAYRLHAVKRAMEEQGERRLLHYDGWAGHAELLRAVLPHARRVDAVEVEDRPDRLQRPRRERPLASAWQVRSMAAGQEPPGLVPVDELDGTAATASRSRERTTLSGLAAAAGASRGRRSSGEHGSRPRRPERGERDRPRERGSGRSEAGTPQRDRGRSRAEDPERGEGQRRRERRRPEPTADGATEPRSRERQRPERPRPQRDAARPAGGAVVEAAEANGGVNAPATPPDAATAEALELIAQAGEDAGAAAPRKRRRRRRTRGGGSGTSAAAAAEGAEPGEPTAGTEPDAGLGVVEAGAAENGDAEGAGGPERKRRRRGGRGRRRPRREGDPTVESAGEAGEGEPAGTDAPGQSATGEGSAGNVVAGDVPGAGREGHGEAS